MIREGKKAKTEGNKPDLLHHMRKSKTAKKLMGQWALEYGEC